MFVFGSAKEQRLPKDRRGGDCSSHDCSYLREAIDFAIQKSNRVFARFVPAGRMPTSGVHNCACQNRGEPQNCGFPFEFLRNRPSKGTLQKENTQNLPVLSGRWLATSRLSAKAFCGCLFSINWLDIRNPPNPSTESPPPRPIKL